MAASRKRLSGGRHHAFALRALLGCAVLGAALAGWSGGNDALAEQARVDLALVLAIDVSKSISAEEHRLQLDGYAAAFRRRAVLDAIADGANGVIAVTVLEWAEHAVAASGRRLDVDQGHGLG